MLVPFQKTNRSAYLNFIQSKYEMFRGQVQVQSYPYYMLVEPSDFCQLRCTTCPTGLENEARRHQGTTYISREKREKLSLSLLDAFLEEVGEYLFMIVFYNYGEPFLNQDLPEIIRRAKAYDIITDIHSNLSLPLSDERLEAVLVAGADSICASIDGFTQETYQKHRVGGDISLAKHNLERLVKIRDQLGLTTDIVYNFLVFSFNEHEIPHAQRYCADLGIRLNPRDAFIHDPTWLPSYRKHEQPIVLDEALQLPPGFGHWENGQSQAWSPLPNLPLQPQRCAWQYGYSIMSSGGKLATCCAVPHDKNDLGTFIPGITSFNEAWNSDQRLSSRAAFSQQLSSLPHPVETVCTQCPVPWKVIHHLYSIQDFKVLSQFSKAFKGGEVKIRAALDLFSKCRYKVPLTHFDQDEITWPDRILGPEENDGIAKFVDFVERFLSHEFPPSQTLHKLDVTVS